MEIEKETRPWGKFSVLNEGSGFKVKLIVVNPEGCLSLQSHKRRSEHWVITKGEAIVTIENKVRKYSTGQHIYIPLAAKHRLENKCKDKLELVEVQCGDYLGEDDIIRYADIYNRN